MKGFHSQQHMEIIVCECVCVCVCAQALYQSIPSSPNPNDQGPALAFAAGARLSLLKRHPAWARAALQSCHLEPHGSQLRLPEIHTLERELKCQSLSRVGKKQQDRVSTDGSLATLTTERKEDDSTFLGESFDGGFLLLFLATQSGGTHTWS